MTLLKDTLIAITAATFLLLALVAGTVEPAFATPKLEWPPKVGATISVTTVCDRVGYEALKYGFENDMDMDSIDDIYQRTLTSIACVSLGVFTVDVVITAVSAPINMSTGAIVYVLDIDLDGSPEQFYTFVIMDVPQQGIAT